MNLTATHENDNLIKHSHKMGVRFQTRKTRGASVAPLLGCTLFLCPKSVLTSVKRSLYDGVWITGVVSFCTASETSFYITPPPNIQTLTVAYSVTKGTSHMTFNTQNPSIFQDINLSTHLPRLNEVQA